ncbi:uncharacterized protein FOMMEDRAFT_154829 [Fomitiporia mediterranea MF3/22]|uniref:uncharacterized protein n=1 Tax=Fomitiporia mediterranea (strain MF3/22) TaxID=694068 RepID=UPI00044083FB|nr:uncharacterized protein FOMMEDRAFT_154829 [Fomitiporia mediterranea MF3/22]EJD03726.1 hypothetical protein FOMMEDRAFT_154829 [Fomitiporia mediterranea MF3/22]
MSQNIQSTIQLNNFLQGRRQAHLISWVEVPHGPQNHRTWSVTCKYNGSPVGEACASHKAEAKERAAAQALTVLRGY